MSADSNVLSVKCIFAAVVASLGSGFQHGYNTGVINAPEKVIERWIKSVRLAELNSTYASLDEKSLNLQVTFIYSTIVSIYVLGGMVGGLLTNLWLTRVGLKWGIIVNNILVFISSIMMGFSKSADSYYLMLIGRFLVGVNSGLNAGLVPIYLSEISPMAWRGTIGSLYQLFITVSIMVSQILGLSSVLGTENQWQILFFLISVVGVFQVICLPFCADSPKRLYVVGEVEAAKKALKWLRGTEQIHAELEELKMASEADKERGAFRFMDLFSRRECRQALTISCIMMVAQQFSGINAIIYYSTATFREANLGDIAEIGTLSVGVVNVIITIISVVVVDKTGRRPLLIFAFGAMFIDTILFCISFIIASEHKVTVASYLCIAFYVLYIVFFASGLGSIPWFLVSELFSQQAKPIGASVAVAVNWLANFIVGLTFLPLQEFLGPYVFIIFVVLQFIFLLYIITEVPETKNRPVEEIIAMLKMDASAETATSALATF